MSFRASYTSFLLLPSSLNSRRWRQAPSGAKAIFLDSTSIPPDFLSTQVLSSTPELRQLEYILTPSRSEQSRTSSSVVLTLKPRSLSFSNDSTSSHQNQIHSSRVEITPHSDSSFGFTTSPVGQAK